MRAEDATAAYLAARTELLERSGPPGPDRRRALTALTDDWLHALFVASGPGIERGITVPAFANVHVQALIAALTGVAPPPSDARRAVIAPLLVKALR